jgi:hypothetical protein
LRGAGQSRVVFERQYLNNSFYLRNQSVISRYINNVFKEGELKQKSNMQKMHIAINALDMDKLNDIN